MQERRSPITRGWLLAGLLLFLFYLCLGAYLAMVRGYLPYDALARLVSAYLVFYGQEMKLATIGFVWPPIPTLLILPLAVFRPLVRNWLAVVIVSAASMAFAALQIDQIARLCGLKRMWRWLVVLLFAINPVMVVFGANGMSEAVLIAATLSGCYWLVRFWKSDRNMDLLITAVHFSILPLIRYEAAVLTAAAGGLILLQTWAQGQRRMSLPDFRDYLEGRLLGYGGLAVYPLFLWAVASWFIMGSPLYFLFNERSALSLAEDQLSSYSGMVTSWVSAFGATFGVWTWLFPVGVIASAAAIYLAIREKKPFLAGFGLTPFILPLVQWVLLMRSATVPLLRYFVMAVPLGIVTGLAVYSALQPLTQKKPRWGFTIPLGFVLLIAASNLASAYTLKTYQYQNIESATWEALTTRNEIPNQDVNDGLAVGRVLAEAIPSGTRVLVDTYQFGFAVVLGADRPKMFFDFTDSHYDAAVLNPPAYVDYVLVPKAEGRGALYSVNRYHPDLHASGAAWAEEVDILPDTNLNWKLYRVKSLPNPEGDTPASGTSPAITPSASSSIVP